MTDPTDLDVDARAEEMPCQECGRRNPVWFASSPSWNLAVGGDAGREAGGMLCPSCFHSLWLAATGPGESHMASMGANHD
jgi:hypothetical protein